MKIFKDLLTKHGAGMVLGAITLDGYRRQVLNDRNNNILDKIRKERSDFSEEQRQEYDKWIDMENKKNKTQSVFCEYSESADEHKKAVEKYNTNPNEYNKTELEKQTQKLDKSYEEIKKLDISETLSSLYNKYNEFLDSLTPDKIVCLFNIIIDGLILSSFISVLSIMLSENIINKIGFLEKYPKILKLLKLRNNINKKISKFYLLMHFIIITIGILGNIYMFFI
uniref:Uncharacterized protein n=1 Tax=Laccaria amethystina TaxID=89243 RepID=A0A4D6SSR9_9AGAR|nr:hypothetical protein [Laccaria amethystina]QCG70062.1 hypothetical protein [Laccaria amethystina]